MSGLYIHVPFCRRACSYCDFYFSTTGTLRDAYVEALLREIAATPPGWTSEPVETVYFGGGTPSMLASEALAAILEAFRRVYRIESGAEITLEANPEDIDADRCYAWCSAGINRLSLGIQTFDAATLKWMNRPHSPQEAMAAIETVARAGFRSFSCDLIYALPGQTGEALLDDLRTLLAFNPPHVSAYTLTVEEGTRLSAWVQAGRLKPADDDRAADFMDLTAKALSAAGYDRYEVSNFCLPGHHSRHNSAYWTHRPYFGYGPGAHSFQPEPGGGGLRWHNPPKLNRYVKCDAFDTFRVPEEVDAAGLREEKIYLRLRTSAGLDLTELGAGFPGGKIPGGMQRRIDTFVQQGLLKRNGTVIAISPSGYPVSDRIAFDILSENGA